MYYETEKASVKEESNTRMDIGFGLTLKANSSMIKQEIRKFYPYQEI